VWIVSALKYLHSRFSSVYCKPESFRVDFPMRSLDFSVNLILQPYYGCRVNSPVTEMSTSIFPEVKGRLVHKADDLITI
jgi:hypothetical protein